MSATVVLGSELDPALARTLLEVLLEMDHGLTVRAEIYMGRSLTGERSTVEWSAGQVGDRMAG